MKYLILILAGLLVFSCSPCEAQEFYCVDGQHTTTTRVNAQGFAYVFPLGEGSGPEVKLDTVFLEEYDHLSSLLDEAYIVKSDGPYSYHIVRMIDQYEINDDVLSCSYLDEIWEGVEPTQNHPDTNSYVYGFYWLSDAELEFNHY